MTMADLNLILSIASFIGVCAFLAMEYSQSRVIKQMQNDIYNNYDALDKRLYDLDYKYSCQIRDVRIGCDNTAQWRNELMKKKYDELTNCHSATENRVADLASRVWMMEGNVETLKPYIKKVHLKKLSKTAGEIYKNSLKELKEIENELK
jgi:hypothetical protein